MIIMVNLGWGMARIIHDPRNGHQLRIVMPANEDDTFFTPAQSIAVYGEHIKALRDALNQAFPVEVIAP